jgi:hypothetical protein
MVSNLPHGNNWGISLEKNYLGLQPCKIVGGSTKYNAIDKKKGWISISEQSRRNKGLNIKLSKIGVQDCH